MTQRHYNQLTPEMIKGRLATVTVPFGGLEVGDTVRLLRKYQGFYVERVGNSYLHVKRVPMLNLSNSFIL